MKNKCELEEGLETWPSTQNKQADLSLASISESRQLQNRTKIDIDRNNIFFAAIQFKRNYMEDQAAMSLIESTLKTLLQVTLISTLLQHLVATISRSEQHFLANDAFRSVFRVSLYTFILELSVITAP